MDVSTLKKYILTVHPVRRTARQKADFRAWLESELKRSGWRVREETGGRLNGSVNVVCGDPEKAELFFIAHYDTPARMPVADFVSPTNIPAHVCYHLLAAVGLALLAFALAFAVSFPLDQPGLMLPLFLVLAVVLLGLSAYGPANRQNANGSSGTLALLYAAGRLRAGSRLCLVFLDNNERNMLGSSAFRKKHADQADRRLFVNLDCVGDGEHLLLMPSRRSRWDAGLLRDLRDSFPESGKVRPHVLDRGLWYYPSDHRRFRFHVAVCACRRLSGLGYYIPHLRTKRDTVLREENVEALAEGLSRFAEAYLGG